MSTASSSPASSLQLPASSYRIIGIGNAGVNFLDRLLLANPSFSGLVAVNNDPESLAASVVPTQIALPADVEFSPDVSFEDVAKVAPLLVEEINQASVVILVGGLGGVFGSELLPRVAAMSKAAKKATLACVSLPFSFEGKRTQSAAAISLAALEKESDGILLLDNDRLCAKKSSTVALGETFAASDEAMGASLPALLAILLNKGPVRITRSNFLKALQRRSAKSCVGYGQATGPNRLHEALESALKNPLLDRGRCFAKASDIFLLLSGPKDISFAEAQAAMQELERLAGEEHDIQMSVHAQEAEGSPLKIFLLAIIGGNTSSAAKALSLSRAESLLLKKEVSSYASPSTLERPPVTQSAVPIVANRLQEETKPLNQEVKELFPEAVYKSSEELHDLSATKSSTASKTKPMQGALNLKTIQRGRFDKSEPTIVEGEDLDTPTYLRLGLKLG
ncbi:MAG: hypothetical protein ACOYK6_02735 [Chthoniobacterales bacterium]